MTKSWCWLAPNGHSWYKKSVVSSFKLQQACEAKLQFILACPCKSKNLNHGHRDAYIEGSG
jgi:hypothetical protein